MDPSQRERFTGRIYVQSNAERAAAIAQIASTQESTDSHYVLNLFCDGSMDTTNTHRGGISVVYQPFIPGTGSRRDLIGAAWPVNPIYDPALGELLALSEALTIALHQLAGLDEAEHLLSGGGGLSTIKPLLIRIFNDNMFNIQYLAHSPHRRLAPHLLTLAQPVLDLVAMQSWALVNMRPGVELELHWIPGHKHRVEAHRWADELAKGARATQMAYDSSRRGEQWFRGGESCVVPFIRGELDDAAEKADRAESGDMAAMQCAGGHAVGAC
jgi:ribonuclease HI